MGRMSASENRKRRCSAFDARDEGEFLMNKKAHRRFPEKAARILRKNSGHLRKPKANSTFSYQRGVENERRLRKVLDTP